MIKECKCGGQVRSRGTREAEAGVAFAMFECDKCFKVYRQKLRAPKHKKYRKLYHKQFKELRDIAGFASYALSIGEYCEGDYEGVIAAIARDLEMMIEEIEQLNS